MDAELIFTGAGKPQRRVKLCEGETLTIGRDPACDLILPKPSVSRRHATVLLKGTQLEVVDLESRNGTFVRSRHVSERAVELRHGETLRIGGFSLTLRLLEANGDLTEALDAPRVPGYEPLARIGQGSSSQVFSAIDQETGEVVAIKVLTAKESIDRTRFRREARLLSSLHSPNLVQVLRFHEGKSTCIVMEFVEGRTLLEEAQDGLSLGRAAKVAAGLAQALATLHASGIVHRDVKPANVLLSYAGEVKLTDLGIARDYGSVLTNPGEGLGTLGYMPPEQLSDACEVDARADLYGLGATLYFALTGLRPLPIGDNIHENIDHVLNRKPLSLTLRREEIPEHVDHLVLKLLSKEPDRRGDSAAELVPTFEQWQRLFQTPSGETSPEAETWDRDD